MNNPIKLEAFTEKAAFALLLLSALGLLNTLFLTPVLAPVSVVSTTILLTLVLCIAHAGATKGWKKALVFSAISFVISWIVEFVGCNYGWWFGDYEYTEALGVMVGNVPLLVVVSWETVIYPSHLLVDEFIGKKGNSLLRTGILGMAIAALATAMVTTTWDIMTDPVAVTMKWWTWDNGGAFLPDIDGGIPFSNYWGWIEAVFIISFLYRLMFDKKQENAGEVPVKTSTTLFAASLYSSLFLGGINNLIILKLYEPCFIGVFTMGPIVAVAWGKYFAQRAAMKN